MISTYELSRVPLRCLFSTIGRVHAEGIGNVPREGGVVLVSNHLTMLDPPLLGALMPRQLHFMAKEELFRIPLLGWYLTHAGTFSIRRGEADRHALRHAEDLLRAGEIVMIFPEGHRSQATGAREARSGAVMLATRTNSPIVPAAITGTEHLRLHRPFGQVARGFLSRPRISVTIGEPIRFTRGGGSAARKAGVDQLMRKITALLPPEYHGIYAEGQA
ncbi:MAG: lysophospholipid acyltransferase family protein [Chloroflexota bacterium]